MWIVWQICLPQHLHSPRWDLHMSMADPVSPRQGTPIPKVGLPTYYFFWSSVFLKTAPPPLRGDPPVLVFHPGEICECSLFSQRKSVWKREGGGGRGVSWLYILLIFNNLCDFNVSSFVFCPKVSRCHIELRIHFLILYREPSAPGVFKFVFCTFPLLVCFLYFTGRVCS